MQINTILYFLMFCNFSDWLFTVYGMYINPLKCWFPKDVLKNFLDLCVYTYVNITVKPCYKAMVQFHYLTSDGVYPFYYIHFSCDYDYIPHGVRWVNFFCFLCVFSTAL